MARRGHASTWGGGTALASVTTAQGAGAGSSGVSSTAAAAAAAKAGPAGAASHVPRHHLAQEILAVMAGKDGLDELDDGMRDSDNEDGSERDYYFSD